MRILHTESSNGWGGQEIRILRESIGLRARGHEVIMAVVRGGGLVAKAREAGFVVYELDFSKSKAVRGIASLCKIIRAHEIDLVNTHSSLDSWLGGIAARFCRKRVVRTRHLSTPIRKGINSRLLYNTLADFVVTTSSGILQPIQAQAKLPSERCKMVATGVEPEKIKADAPDVRRFRESLGDPEFLVGTACFVRSWKGIKDLMQAANLLREHSAIKWVIIGGGYVDQYRGFAKELNLDNILFFTGHLDNPFPAIAALDVFTLLSTAHEGISQACLQAAYLEKPMITTAIGGLPEVCLNEKTGFVVNSHAPQEVADAVLKLYQNPELRKEFGSSARELVENKFTMQHTLDQMEEIFSSVLK